MVARVVLMRQEEREEQLLIASVGSPNTQEATEATEKLLVTQAVVVGGRLALLVQETTATWGPERSAEMGGQEMRERVEREGEEVTQHKERAEGTLYLAAAAAAAEMMVLHAIRVRFVQVGT